MVVLKDSNGVEIKMELPITLSMETYEHQGRSYEIKPSYLWDEQRKKKDRTKVRGCVMIGK